MSAADVVELLRAQLGDRVDTDPIALEATRADKSGHASPGAPLAIVHAQSVDDVQATLRIAHATATPVVTRGAGTGLAGGANAGPGELVLSLARMDRVLEIRADDLLAVVEPGILNARLNELLAEHGVWWAPDPASREISTVGGNIATGAGVSSARSTASSGMPCWAWTSCSPTDGSCASATAASKASRGSTSPRS